MNYHSPQRHHHKAPVSSSLRKLRRTFLLLTSAWLAVMFLECFDSTRYAQYQKQTFVSKEQQARREKLVQELTLLLEEQQAIKQNFVMHDNATDVCAVWPGHGLEEGGFMGYQVLLRMRSFFAKLKMQPKPSLLCVWFLDQRNEGDSDDSVVVYQTARDLYRQTCHGILQVNITNIKTSSAMLSSGNFHSIQISTLLPRELTHVFQQITKLKDYTWFHWTDPKRFFLIPQHLQWLLTGIRDNTKPNQKPQTLQSWIMESPPETNTRYHQMFGQNPLEAAGCETPRTANMAAAQKLAKCRQKMMPSNNNNNAKLFDDSLAALQYWMAACFQTANNVPCHRQNPLRDRRTQWMFLQRYFELQLPGVSSSSSSTPDFSLRRLHAILYGGCDPVWDQSFGALDQDGTPGYIHDPTFLRKNPPNFAYHVDGEEKGVCDIPLGQGEEGVYGYKGLKKIKIAGTHQTEKRVFCMVYTHSNAHKRVQAISETWGPRCDGFMAASNVTDLSIGAVDLLHEGPEMYNNMWLKVRSMFQYVYDNYLEEFDFFHIGGDDHYVIPENLRYTVSTGSWQGPWDDTQPLFLGGSLPLNPKRRYCNGGSGYTLNRAALKLLVEVLLPTPKCKPHWQSSTEDQCVSSCFRSIGIQCMDTNDERNETRYHTWNVDQHAAWKVGKPGQKWKTLVDFHGIAWKEGLGQISESSVSFHLKREGITTVDSGMRRYHAILYGLCPENKLKANP